MSLSDVSFKMYTDSGLTSLFGGTYTILHKTDLSDNPQDFTLYFGSTVADRVIYAVSNPGVDNITLTPTDKLPIWAASTAYTSGQDVQPTVSNGLRYEITTSGTSGATEPTWPTSNGSTVTNGTVVFTCRGAKHATTEIKLATSAIGLDSATAGAALSLGNNVLSTSANAVAIYIRITNAVTVVSSSGIVEIAIDINNIQEEAV